MLSQGQVGPLATTASLSPGSQPTLRMGNMGEQIVSNLHGHHYEAAYRRSLFAAATQSVTTTTVGLAATYTGLCVSNPVGSPVNLSILRVGWAFLVAFPAAAALGLMKGFNSGTNVTHTTPVTPIAQNTAASGVGLADVSCTMPTAPVLNTVLGSGVTGAITTSMQISPSIYDLNGTILLPPGGYVAFYTSTVSGTSAFFGSMLWEEIPI